MAVVIWDTMRRRRDPELSLIESEPATHVKLITPHKPYAAGGYTWMWPWYVRPPVPPRVHPGEASP